MGTFTTGIHFDGTASEEYTGNSTSLYDFSNTNEDFTAACWFYLDNTTGEQGIVACAANGWIMRAESATLNWTKAGSDDIDGNAGDTMTITSGTWYFAAISGEDGGTLGSSTWLIETDGTYRKRTDSSNSGIGAATQPITMGVDGSRNNEIEGIVTYVQVWDRRLTDNEVRQAAWHPGSVVNGLLGYWPLLGRSSEPDMSGNDGSATLSGSPPVESNISPPVKPTF